MATGNASHSAPPPPQASPPKKILVAVHGMGDQTPYKTLQDLVHLVFGSRQMPQGVPIGRLHSDLMTPASRGKKPAEQDMWNRNAWSDLSPIKELGFAEVFWADIARDHEEYVLEDVVRWADTLVNRLEVIDSQARKRFDHLEPLHTPAVQRTLRDIALAVRLLRMGNKFATKIGLGSIELDQLLVRYLGDVQLFAEFESPRNRILQRFKTTMDKIDARAGSDDVEIHICAHSWGSVVAFLGLLEGHCDNEPWFRRVKSLMTIGAPIDKALVLWPKLWNRFVLEPPHKHTPQRIAWFNYADKGDPVGHNLDFARMFCDRLDLFAQDAPVERNYRRYAVPGKAHVDYWQDQGPFNEWFHKIGIRSEGAPEPKTRILRAIFSQLLLFLFPFGFAWGAAHCLGAAINGIAGATYLELRDVLSIAALIYGMIAFSTSRSMRQRRRWLAGGAGLAAIGVSAAWICMPYPEMRVVITILIVAAVYQISYDWSLWSSRKRDAEHSIVLSIGIPAVILFGGFAAEIAISKSGDARTTTMITLLQFIAVIAAAAIVLKLIVRQFRSNETNRGVNVRRTAMWLGIIAVVSTIALLYTARMGPGAVFGNIALLATAGVSWALTVLFWSLAMVWTEFLATGLHMQRLKTRWYKGESMGKPSPESKAKRDAPTLQEEPESTGLWWLDQTTSESHDD